MLITGSQLWTDTTVVRDALAQVWHPDTILMSGACPRGADRLCEDCWTHWGGKVDRYPAQWVQDGRYRPDAGFRRNEDMVQAAADLDAQRCLAFILNDSPGATHTAGLTRQAGIWTTVYRASTAPGARDSASLGSGVPHEQL
ncbi:SLOG family protein [Umezawaea sp. Da 62-37]|uniref:SLOG family protein n=1 Tax=Umezawaea sp. Da 62-37 TaxID=3075927 RepID=UPI0028F7299E|nr:SLOG family protein [Umezawaea sp. Da 62-37]WNV83137.1 SLOG family protein [Umezawaea sp. Da 62-37]